MSVSLNVNEEKASASENAPGLKWPYCGFAKLVGVTKTPWKDKDVVKGYNLDFEWVLRGNTDNEAIEPQYRTPAKTHFNLREWNLPTGDSEKETTKRENALARLAYILTFFMTREDETHEQGKARAIDFINSIEGETWQHAWENLCDKVIAWFEKVTPANYSKSIKQIKVLGNLNQSGKPTLDIPRYNNFIADDKSEHSLSFSSKEEEGNAQYIMKKEMMKSQPSAGAKRAPSGSPTGNVPSADDLPSFEI